MAEWNSNPEWNDLESINGGFNFNSFLDISASDFNKLVENMQYLYKNSGKGEFNMDKIYPKGSIYMTLDPTFNPAEAFGGTWQKLTDRFLVGAGGAYDVETKGGTTSHKHGSGTLGATVTMVNSSILISSIQQKDGINHNPTARINASSRDTYAGVTDYIVPVIGYTSDATHMPPYYAVYMWQRIE